MQRFSVRYIPFSPDNRKQIVFVHYAEDGFGIMMDSVSLQPDMYPAVAIGTSAFFLALADLLSQRQILCRYLHPFNIPIVTAAGDTKEAAHLADAILLPVAVDYLIFDAGLHSFPVSERKSRSNSFSILSRCIS